MFTAWDCPATLIWVSTTRLLINCLLFMVFQQMFANVDGCIINSFIVHMYLCDESNVLLLSKIMASAFFMTGLSTILMATFGVR